MGLADRLTGGPEWEIGDRGRSPVVRSKKEPVIGLLTGGLLWLEELNMMAG